VETDPKSLCLQKYSSKEVELVFTISESTAWSNFDEYAHVVRDEVPTPDPVSCSMGYSSKYFESEENKPFDFSIKGKTGWRNLDDTVDAIKKDILDQK